jgi:hypothetical protein
MTLLVAALLSTLAAQEAAVLENTGKPMRVEVRCGEEDILHFGLTCTAQDTCPVYLELTAVGPLGSKIFLIGNLHTSSTTLASILLASDDAGKTWREPHERIRAAGLDQIQFLDYEYGWVGGQLLLAVPKDPFLLLTNDGGKTWRRRPVFGESRAGAIEQFWFSSRSNGLMWIDRTQSGEDGMRHELYETMTGGDSWMVRQVSDRPISVKRMQAGPGNPDWRLRPDAATKSYKVEKRQGEAWQTVASFLIAVGECQVQEQPLAEPAPPTAGNQVR